jgi:hypothetical protein
VSHTVKPSYPKSSFSVIAAAMPAGLPTPQNESITITDKVTGRPVKKKTSLKKRVFVGLFDSLARSVMEKKKKWE